MSDPCSTTKLMLLPGMSYSPTLTSFCDEEYLGIVRKVLLGFTCVSSPKASSLPSHSEASIVCS